MRSGTHLTQTSISPLAVCRTHGAPEPERGTSISPLTELAETARGTEKCPSMSPLAVRMSERGFVAVRKTRHRRCSFGRSRTKRRSRTARHRRSRSPAASAPARNASLRCHRWPYGCAARSGRRRGTRHRRWHCGAQHGQRTGRRKPRSRRSGSLPGASGMCAPGDRRAAHCPALGRRAADGRRC